jgi:hypothetical protein
VEKLYGYYVAGFKTWTDMECTTWDHLDLVPVWLKVVNLVDTR